jgi:NAD(P)-dependent dehydrogenase (short-subunit alcohol dehydrogenase family)
MSASDRRLSLTFRGSTALVTGAASGIGHATVEMLGSAGLRVIAVDRDPSVQQAAEDWASRGLDVVSFVVDIVDEAMVTAGLAELAPDDLAYVVNCAGIHGQYSFDDIPVAEWRRVLDVNLLGAFAVTRAAARWLRPTGHGAVVNVTSVEAHRVVALINPDATPHYAASKAGLDMLTRSMAHALAGDCVRVNAVAPGFVATPMTRGNHAATALPETAAAHSLIKRYADPAEVAAAISFLLSDAASFITGTTLRVDGGFTV